MRHRPKLVQAVPLTHVYTQGGSALEQYAPRLCCTAGLLVGIPLRDVLPPIAKTRLRTEIDREAAGGSAPIQCPSGGQSPKNGVHLATRGHTVVEQSHTAAPALLLCGMSFLLIAQS